ncbi:MAG: ABC transporter permease [Deltaproteobacteria bacterium]
MRGAWRQAAFAAPGVLLLAFLAVPLLALVVTTSPSDLASGLAHPLVGPALWLSVETTAISMAIVVVCGLPLAWTIARGRGRLASVVETFVALPIVIPPAVAGIALLLAFGRSGPLGAAGLPFTTAAVIAAQVTVSAPFFLQSAIAGFRKVDPDLILVARTLGASPVATFFRVTIPLAWPAILAGLGLAWARALGEFGATLLFAGNLSGRTQTMPLAIYAALESDVRAAQALALLLAVAAFGLLLLLRLIPAGAR